MVDFRSIYETFFCLYKTNDLYKKKKWLIQLGAGLPARPRPHFVILEDSGNGKVQKVSPKGIYKRKLPWAG